MQRTALLTLSVKVCAAAAPTRNDTPCKKNPEHDETDNQSILHNKVGLQKYNDESESVDDDDGPNGPDSFASSCVVKVVQTLFGPPTQGYDDARRFPLPTPCPHSSIKPVPVSCSSTTMLAPRSTRPQIAFRSCFTGAQCWGNRHLSVSKISTRSWMGSYPPKQVVAKPLPCFMSAR